MQRYSTIGYLMDPNKYYNNNASFVPGTVGGNTVSLYSKNLVDLESDLTGRTRGSSKCACGKFLPGTIVQSKDACKCGNPNKCGCMGSKLVHLPNARMINFKPTVKTVGFNDTKSKMVFKSSRNGVSDWDKKILPAWTE